MPSVGVNWKDVQHVNDICVMAPTLQLAEKAEMLIKQENYQNIDVVVAASGRQETVKCAQTLAAAGAEIIITRKGTRRIVEEVTNLKVVSLNNSLSDYLWMLKERGLHTPGLIAFFSYDPMSSDILQMCEMLEVQTKNYIFKSFADCRGCVERALKDGAVFSVGGAWTDPWAKRLGLPHVIVENSVETILNALESATQLRIVEIRSLKRILDAAGERRTPVLCFVDEVLRGTNTVERIAAATQILIRLAESGTLGFAATHDIEMTELLKEYYDNYHFEEVIRDGDILFPYQLLPGKASTRNAIRLLQMMGYEEQIIKKASGQAENFLKTGKWINTPAAISEGTT